jgi:hypothetical protein
MPQCTHFGKETIKLLSARRGRVRTKKRDAEERRPCIEALAAFVKKQHDTGHQKEE